MYGIESFCFGSGGEHLWTLWMHQIWFHNALDYHEDPTKAFHHQNTIAQNIHNELHNIHTILTNFARNLLSVLWQKGIEKIQRELMAQNVNFPWNMCKEKCAMESMQLKKQNQHWLSSIVRWNQEWVSFLQAHTFIIQFSM